MEALHVGVEARGGVVTHAGHVPAVAAFADGCAMELWAVCRPKEKRGAAAVTGMCRRSRRRWRMSLQPERRTTAYVARTSGVCRQRRTRSACVAEEEGGGRSGGHGDDDDRSCHNSGDGEVVA